MLGSIIVRVYMFEITCGAQDEPPLNRSHTVPCTQAHSTLASLLSALPTSQEWMGWFVRAFVLLEGGVSPWQLAPSLARSTQLAGQGLLYSASIAIQFWFDPWRVESLHLFVCFYSYFNLFWGLQACTCLTWQDKGETHDALKYMDGWLFILIKSNKYSFLNWAPSAIVSLCCCPLIFSFQY